MSAKQSEFSFFILCFAVKLQQYYLICLMKIILAFELKKCTSEVPAPFSLISMARLSKQADTSLDYLGFIKNNVTQCPSLAFLLAWFTCTRRECQMHLLGKKIFLNTIYRVFSNSQLLGSGVVSHSWVKKIHKWIPLLLTTLAT